MSNLVEHAKKEIELYNKKYPHDEYGSMVMKAALELVEVFSKQGHSGFSAGITTSTFDSLADFRPLTPLTGEESEWGTEVDKNQNNRYGSVFRREDGTAFNGHAKVFSDDGGKSWFTNGNSFEDITFPYTVPSEPERVLIPEEDKKDYN